VTVREGKFCFTAPTTASQAPTASGGAANDPLVLTPGGSLLRFRSVLTSAGQVSKVEVRGWDIASKLPLTATAPAKTRSAELPTVTPENLAKVFGDPVYVSTDVPYRTQAEVEEAAAALADEMAAVFAEFEGVARGNPKIHAGAALSITGMGEPFDGKYTVTTSRHRFDPGAGYTTSFSVTGRQDRSMLGLASGGARASRAPAGVVIGQVTDVADPDKQARVRVKFPWLSEEYVSDWARTVHAGAGKNRGWTILPEVGDEVLVCFEAQDFSRPYVLGGLNNGVDTLAPGSPDLVDSASGAVNRRSLVSRRGHRIDLLDADGKTEGIRMTTKDDKLELFLDSVGTTVTVHADGKVLVEGSQGITIDAASADLTLKGGKIALTATSGVTVDGGGGAVDVKAGGPLSLSGVTAKLDGGPTTDITGGLIKIN
jgi:phage baseplate assembly protein gpV